MKRRKLYLIASVTITSIALLGGCSKQDTTKTAFAGEIATESVMAEMLTKAKEIETETGTEISQLKPTTDENGNTIYPDYPEDYVKFEDMDEKTMYVIKMGTLFFNPNMFEGQLNKWGEAYPKGELESDGEMTVNGKCEIDGVEYYRSEVQNNTTENLTVIIEASCLSDTPPAEDTSDNSTADITYITDPSQMTEEELEILNEDPSYEEDIMTAEELESMWFEPGEGIDYNDPEVQAALDAAAGMVLQ